MEARFETAALASAVGKAARIAPTKGSAFDTCSGIMFEFNPIDQLVTIRATNELIYYLEVVDAISMEGETTVRLSSIVMNGILSKLPIGSGKEVTLITDDSHMQIIQGRMKARIRQLDKSYYPEWEPFSPDGLEIVENLGERIKAVEWAADTKGLVALSGVHLDGQSIVATDRYRVATMPCVAPPIHRPITVPVGIFDPIVRSMTDVAVGITEGMFLLMPDAATQIKTVIIADPFPNVDGVMKRNQSHCIEFERDSLLEMIERALVIGTASGDRTPLLKLFIGCEEIAVMMEDQELGLLGDVIDIPGYATHDRIILHFTPKNLTEPLRLAPNNKIKFYYNIEKTGASPIRIDGGSGFEVWVMGRADLK